MRPEGFVVLAIGVALMVMAMKGSWQKIFPFMVSSTKPGDCPPGYTATSVPAISGLTGTNYCTKSGL